MLAAQSGVARTCCADVGTSVCAWDMIALTLNEWTYMPQLQSLFPCVTRWLALGLVCVAETNPLLTLTWGCAL